MGDLYTKCFSARVLEAYRAGPQGGLSVRATAGEPAEILLYDQIGPQGVTASDFLAALASAGAGPVRVRINSPGGDVFDGLAIYNALLAHPGGAETMIDGLAASAASVVAMAGVCTMHDASMLMIHCASTFAYGTAADMLVISGVLGKVDAQIASIYSAKSGSPPADCAALMAAESWLTAAEAKEAGLCDTVLPPPVRKVEPAAAVTVAITADAVTVVAPDMSAEVRRRRLRIAEGE